MFQFRGLLCNVGAKLHELAPLSSRAFFSLRTPLKLLMQYSEMERERHLNYERAIGPKRSRQIDDNFCKQLFSAQREEKTDSPLKDLKCILENLTSLNI